MSTVASTNKIGFRNFDHGAADIVLAAEFNLTGTHLAVCSADHKIRLFGQGQRDAWILVDQWRGHDAEILDAISRDGLLSLLEPSEPESLHQWREVDTVFPFGQQSRGSETVFRLSLHQAETPCYGALSAGVDPKTISFCLSADTSIKILRATRSDEGNYRIHEMLEVNSMASKIHDLSWAPGSIRPHDLIAAACNDGRVRVYALTTLQGSQLTPMGLGHGRESPPRERHSSSLATRQNPSGIGAGLAGVSRGELTRRPSGGVRIQHSWKEIAVLPHEAGAPVWRVRWTHDGYARGPVPIDRVIILNIMTRKSRVASVCKEDVLTSRGANPRTGIISPYISNETSEASDGNDYVHFGRVRNECDLKIGAGERWSQDELGWSLVESTNRLYSPLETPTSSGAESKSADSKQKHGSRLLGWDLHQEPSGPTHGGGYGTTGQSVATGVFASANMQDTYTSSPNRKSPLPKHDSQSPSRFRIPRKDVGSSMDPPRLSPTPRPYGAPNFDRDVHGVRPKDDALRSPLPHCLDSVTTRPHGYPLEVSSGLSSHSNLAATSRPVNRYGSLGILEAQQNLGRYPLDVVAARVDSLPPSVSPNLKPKYRRPKELLPARLRGHLSPKHSPEPTHADRSLARGEGAILEQRPQFKRVQATTAVPVAQSVKRTEATGRSKARTSHAPPAPSRGAEVPGYHVDEIKVATSRSASSGPISASVCAARKASDNVQQILESQAIGPGGIAKSVSATAGSACERRHGAETSLKKQNDPRKSCGHTTQEDGSKQGKTHHTLVRRKSIGSGTEIRDTLPALGRELCALVDLDRLKGQLVEGIAHAALILRRMPWAVRTLRRRDANVWDFLLAVRYVLMVLLYLTMLLGFLRAVLKALKVVGELGNCVWYPVGLLLTMVRWTLLH
ncbi:MAG: hypothetical protein Q9210_003263 [Variospora velana]